MADKPDGRSHMPGRGARLTSVRLRACRISDELYGFLYSEPALPVDDCGDHPSSVDFGSFPACASNRLRFEAGLPKTFSANAGKFTAGTRSRFLDRGDRGRFRNQTRWN